MPNIEKIRVSIICPIYNEEEYIAKCLNSILSQDYSLDEMEVLLIDGMSKDNTRAIVKDYVAKYPIIQLLDNPLKVTPQGLNIGVRHANGDYIIRLDAHAEYPPNYISSLIKYAIEYQTDNIGGIIETEVRGVDSKALAIKAVLSHRFGVGNAIFRVGASIPAEVDTVPFGCFKKDVFSRFGLFDTRLVRNQDIELNKRIKMGGGMILLHPHIRCTYFARNRFRPLAWNNYLNGMWNILTVYYTKNTHSISFRHIVPLIFVLSLLLPLLLGLINSSFLWFSVMSLISYLAMVLGVSMNINDGNMKTYVYLISAFIVVHFSYGLGSIGGIIRIAKLKESLKIE
jgi:glycosyltransferase involved in cell wall biosynthesis